MVDALSWSGADMSFSAAGSAGNRLAESDRESAADGIEEGDVGPALHADLSTLRGLPDSPAEPLYERLRAPASVFRLSMPSRLDTGFGMPMAHAKSAQPQWAWGGGTYGGFAAGAGARLERSRLKRSRGEAPYAYSEYRPRQPDPGQWLNAWVPALPSGQPIQRAELRRPDGWSEDAFRLACSLDRRPALASSKATVRFISTARSFAPRRGNSASSVSTLLALSAPDRWLTLAAADQGIPAVTWSTPEQTGAISLPYGLGRVAPREDATAPDCPWPLSDYSTTRLADTYRGFRCRLEAKGRDRVELVLEDPKPPDSSVHVLVDPERHVVLETWTVFRGKEFSRTEFARFREIAGSWWATRVTVRNGDGEVAAQTDIEIDLPDAAAVAGAWAVVDRARADAVLVPAPLPEVVAAKRAAAAGKATVAQRLTLISYLAATQQWDRAQPHLESLRTDLAGKVGWRYLELGFLAVSRRHEEMRQVLLAATGALVAHGLALEPYLELVPADRVPERCGEYALVQALCSQAGPLQANERLGWLDLARPVYDRQPERLEPGVAWLQQRAQYLRQANQNEAALAIEAELSRTRPWDSGALTRYTQDLASVGDYERAVTLLAGALKAPDKAWQTDQLTEVRNALLNTFENAGWHDRQIPLLAALVGDKGTELDAYPCQRYLTALLRADREADADATATAWMEPFLAGAELTPAVLVRATAAAQYMVGEVRGYSSSQWLDERWLPTLAKAVRKAVMSSDTLAVASAVMDNTRFHRTDTCRALRAEFAKRLAGDIAATDFGLVRAQANWIQANDPAVEADTWKTIAGNLEQRWAAEVAALEAASDNPQRPTAEQVNQWGTLTAYEYQAHVGPAAWLGFCRRQYLAAAGSAPLEGAGPQGRTAPRAAEGQRPATADDSVPVEGEGPQGRMPPRAAEGQRPDPLDAYRDAYAQQWFAACLNQPWRQEYEDEAFGALPKLALAAEPPERVLTQAGALQALVDWMVAGRQAAVVAAHTGAPPADGQAPAVAAEAFLPGQEERLISVPAKPLQQLSRTERKKLNTIALELSRETAAARLAAEWERQPEALRPWLAVERLGLLARLAASAAADAAQGRQGAVDLRPPREPAQGRQGAVDLRPPAEEPRGLAAEALELLGLRPPATFASVAEEALVLRRLALAEFLVAKSQPGGPAAERDVPRKTSQSELGPTAAAPKTSPSELGPTAAAPKTSQSELGPTAVALLTTMRAGVAMPDEAQREFWRGRLYRLLLALDRPADMESELCAWVKADDAFSPWRVPLAYLLAETDRLAAAVALLEAVATADELGPAEYRSLADWYAALGDLEEQRASKLKELAATPEEALRQRLEQERQKLGRQGRGDREGVPADLTPDAIDVLTALLRKAEYPTNHAWLVRELYTRTRDVRLLRCLAEGVIGHTAQQVYPLLQSFRDLLREVQSEATLDELAAAIAAVRLRAQTPVDRRALLLLEAEVKRRASEVLSQPRQHVPAALAALQAAFRETWSPGEPRLMAEFLAALGRISQRELAQEQLTQAEALYRRPGESAIDRLEIAHAYGRIFDSQERGDAGIEVLAGALDEYRQTRGGRLANAANAAAGSLIALCEQRRHFAQGEAWLRAELERPANEAQREWLIERLFQLYEEAIRRDGETALGRGQGQYAAVDREIVTELGKPGRPRHLHNLVSRYCVVALVAKSRTLTGYAADLWTFAAEVVPDVLRRETREPGTYQTTVSQVAQALHELASARDGLAFLIACGEAEPAWFRFDYNSFWQQHGGRLAQWRTETKELGDLEPRLLAIVLRELRTDLDRQQQRSRALYHRQQSYFWEEKAGEFAKVAEAVYAQRRESGAAVAYVADYLFYGLGLHERAIAILQDAWQRDLLDENGQLRLGDFLHERQRYQESVPVLAKLVELRPERPEYRRRSVIAYARSDQADQADRARAAAERHFKEHGLWGENAIAWLASGCLDGGLYAWAVTYYDEAIALHRRTVPPAAQGDSTLSDHYASLARAHAGLGDTAAAVEAAAGAVISWGRNLGSRNQAIQALAQILRNAKDLDAYVAGLDQRVSETRRDSPIVRQALGQAYATRGVHEKAVAQFRRALAGQPNDEGTYRSLVASCDALRWPDEAVSALLDLAALLPRDLELRRNITKRLVAMEKPQEAERAATAIVEADPNEAESHQAMATLRQEEDRWPEAIPHWRRVGELRELEPTGLLGLAQAQIHLRQTPDAKITLDRLLATAWPERFGDVHGQARSLIGQLER
jgi:predicted Zn-dependent protease